jgi:hypothetical protein
MVANTMKTHIYVFLWIFKPQNKKKPDKREAKDDDTQEIEADYEELEWPYLNTKHKPRDNERDKDMRRISKQTKKQIIWNTFL